MLRKIRNGLGWLFLFIALLLLGRKARSENRVPISWIELQNILKKTLPKDCGILLLDEKYKLPDLREVQNYIEQDLTDKMQYIPDYQDCDTFARRLWGAFAYPGWGDIPFAWANSPLHAYNLFVDLNKTTYLAEPQSDRIFTPEKFSGLAKDILLSKGIKVRFSSRQIYIKTGLIADRVYKRFANRPLDGFASVFSWELKKEGMKAQFEELQKVRHKVRFAVNKAGKRTKGQALERYVKALAEELEKEDIEDQLEEVYKTIFTMT